MMKVSELTGAMLDYWVAKAEGCSLERYLGGYRMYKAGDLIGFIGPKRQTLLWHYSPSTDWSQGGPIIDREGISLGETYTPTSPRKATICNGPANEAIIEQGKTNLIAAMRCYVASKFGDEVDDS